MKKSIQHICNLLIFFLVLVPASIQGQTDQEWLADLATEEEEAIHALVLYPEDTRLAILEVAMHPEALIKMESIQEKTKSAFQAIVENYPQNTQELIWDLTRYPGLIEQLVAVKNGTNKEIKKALDDYPDIIHERAKEAIRFYGKELTEILQLNREAESAFTSLLTDYPNRTQDALKHLLELPEVLSILTDNIKLTVLIGDLYKKDPARVLQQADSLNLVVARQQAQELENWRKSLEEDPQAREELKASADAFGEEHSYYYDDEYYDQSYDEVYYEERDPLEVHHYYYYHYPYWFAYPHWYAYPRWRQYPYWYDWGFYYSPRRTIIVLGLPSFYFTNWYFYHPYHHYRWSHLSAHFTKHYYTHRKHGSSITAGVKVWQSRNRNIVSNDWLRDDGRLQERFREFGKFEADRARYNRSHPKKQLDQKAFRDRNPDRYRTISSSGVQTRSTEKSRVATQTKRQPTPDPKARKVAIPSKSTRTMPEKKVAPRSSPKIPIVKKGTERHRSISEKNKSTRTRTVQPRTPPKTKAPRKATSKPRTVKKKTSPRKKN